MVTEGPGTLRDDAKWRRTLGNTQGRVLQRGRGATLPLPAILTPAGILGEARTEKALPPASAPALTQEPAPTLPQRGWSHRQDTDLLVVFLATETGFEGSSSPARKLGRYHVLSRGCHSPHNGNICLLSRWVARRAVQVLRPPWETSNGNCTDILCLPFC